LSFRIELEAGPDNEDSPEQPGFKTAIVSSPVLGNCEIETEDEDKVSREENSLISSKDPGGSNCKLDADKTASPEGPVSTTAFDSIGKVPASWTPSEGPVEAGSSGTTTSTLDKKSTPDIASEEPEAETSGTSSPDSAEAKTKDSVSTLDTSSAEEEAEASEALWGETKDSVETPSLETEASAA